MNQSPSNFSQAKPSADPDGFTNASGKGSGNSTFALIRQVALVLLLLLALGGLAWEYLIVVPGYKAGYAYLEKLQTTYIEAGGTETTGDANGDGIKPEFTEESIHAALGFQPQEVIPQGEKVEVQIFRWRRWNMKTYELAVEFTQRGPKKTKVFSNWYDEVAAIPANPSRAVEVPADQAEAAPAGGLIEAEPTPAGGGTVGGGGGSGRRQRPPVDDTPSETPAGETPAGETPASETPAGETPAEETPAGETPAGDGN